MEEILKTAAEHHKAGRLSQAEKLYRQVLEAEPQHPDAIHGMGLLAMQRGDLDKATRLFGHASTLRPDDPAFLNSLGIAYRQSGRLDDAEVCLKRAVTLEPERAETLNNMAELQLAQGRPKEAIDLFDKAIELKPDYHQAHLNLGRLFAAGGDRELAYACFSRADEHSPDSWARKVKIAQAFQGIEAYDRALECFRQAEELDPGNPSIAIAKSSMMLELRDFSAAEQLCRDALVVAPSNPEAHNNLGLALAHRARLDEAVASFTKSLSLNNDAPGVHLNLGNTFTRKGSLDQAIASYARALAVDPDYLPADYARSTVELLKGNLARGFERFPRRRELPFFTDRVPDIDLPDWEGEPLDGKRVLVYPVGEARETVLLLRFIKNIKEMGANVAFGCPPVFQTLAHRLSAVDTVLLPNDALPDLDYKVSLDTLAAQLCKDVSDIPGTPYLEVDPELAKRWEQRFADIEERKIGIMWRVDGDPSDPHENIPFTDLTPFFELPRTRWFSLQYSVPPAELAALRAQPTVEDISQDIAGLADALACVAGLDLLITSDTVTAHLAGAAGIAAWVLVSGAPQWWWSRSGDSSPWYDDLQLIRCSHFGSWEYALSAARELLSRDPSG